MPKCKRLFLSWEALTQIQLCGLLVLSDVVPSNATEQITLHKDLGISSLLPSLRPRGPSSAVLTLKIIPDHAEIWAAPDQALGGVPEDRAELCSGEPQAGAARTYPCHAAAPWEGQDTLRTLGRPGSTSVSAS
ncbi:bis(5'-adenosyl)-triphosphatase isoform X2 [Ammospiza nelsoni]|uniref:bis(5'-adenosyl)-triphosphatase isoform X2 n=1 Tax=Ammospiza nelsoni TaxID=2857394 RepID=UPI002869EA45|nr:bis(5'-adenosyl)-triphosphatase isoform X2 [Ammospiza nelsoni]